MSADRSAAQSVARTLLSCGVVLLLGLAACGGEEGARTGGAADASTPPSQRATRGMPPAVATLLDSGNADFRRGEYERALEHYRRAAEEHGSAAAPWFGIFMVHRARGDSAAADSAMSRVRELSPSASLAHPALGDTTAAADTSGD